MMHLRKFRWLASILTLIATGAPAGETINGIGITMVNGLAKKLAKWH